VVAVRFNVKNIMLNAKAVERALGRRTAIALTRYGKIARQEARKAIKIAVPTSTKRDKARRDIIEGRSNQDWNRFWQGKRNLAKHYERVRAGMGKQSHHGGYPLARTRHKYATIRNIQYAYSKQRESVVIGPLGFTRKTGVPAALEYGGRTTLYERQIEYPKTITNGVKSGGTITKWVPTNARYAQRKRTVKAGYRPSMSLTMRRLKIRKTMEQSILYADRKVKG